VRSCLNAVESAVLTIKLAKRSKYRFRRYGMKTCNRIAKHEVAKRSYLSRSRSVDFSYNSNIAATVISTGVADAVVETTKCEVGCS
jgi:hypothetical protein